MLTVFRLLLKIIVGLLVIALVTLLERGILSLAQIRVGPRKVGPWGLLQPVADAIKLLLKTIIYPVTSNKAYILTPGIFLILALVRIWIIPSRYETYYLYYGAFVLLIISALSVYPILFRGWFSNSKWGIVGSLRGIAQSISYEVSIAFILMSLAIIHNSLSLNDIKTYLRGVIIPLGILIWIVRVLAELNRTPFDLAEGERELVSGYNTEYARSLFTILFIAEYIFIIVIGVYSSILIFRTLNLGLMIIILILLVRATLPRIRIDYLILLCWHSILPGSIVLLLIRRMGVSNARVSRDMYVHSMLPIMF